MGEAVSSRSMLYLKKVKVVQFKQMLNSRDAEGEGALSGTTLLARSEGFLWVISLLSTLRRP